MWGKKPKHFYRLYNVSCQYQLLSDRRRQQLTVIMSVLAWETLHLKKSTLTHCFFCCFFLVCFYWHLYLFHIFQLELKTFKICYLQFPRRPVRLYSYLIYLLKMEHCCPIVQNLIICIILISPCLITWNKSHSQNLNSLMAVTSLDWSVWRCYWRNNR